MNWKTFVVMSVPSAIIDAVVFAAGWVITKTLGAFVCAQEIDRMEFPPCPGSQWLLFGSALMLIAGIHFCVSYLFARFMRPKQQ